VNRLSKFSTEGNTRGRGRVGESAAARWLERSGYRILQTNYSRRPGEIDVVALDGDILCFVEVKARSTPTFGSGVEGISRRKRQRLARAARLYLAESGWQGPCRFDVLGIDRRERGWKFTLVKDAFELNGMGV
jgi:putative endonuclease